MNLNPFTLLRRVGAKFTNTGGQVVAADAQSMGPWSGALGNFLPRQVNPWLYEALREAIPMLDGALNRLVTLDGIVTVEGNNQALCDEILDWMAGVPVNDAEGGLQAFYASQGNEVYEQGVSCGEFVVKGRDIVGLRVADSKGLLFTRDDAGLHVWYRAPGQRFAGKGDGYDTVEAILRRSAGTGSSTGPLDSGYVQLDRRRLVYVVNHPEADNPYGASMLRSLEFVSQLLLKIQNALGRSWERYGDPPLHMIYKTKNAKLTAAELKVRETLLAEGLRAALTAKAKGNSVDLVNAIGALDDITLSVIGANGFVMDVDVPAKHLLEQVVAKFGLPPWMLGLQWNTTAGQAEQQSIVVLQESKTRFERRRPGLETLIKTMLRLRGRTWSRNDWRLVQQLPNLQDEMKQAQAEFLRAQTAMMRGEVGDPTQGIDNNLRSPRRAGTPKARKTPADDSEGEPWAEPDSHLPAIERRQIAAQLKPWRKLAAQTLKTVGLSRHGKAAKAEDDEPLVWRFQPDWLAELVGQGDEFLRTSADPESAAVVKAEWEAFLRGWANAAAELDTSAAVTDALAAVRGVLRERGLQLVRSTTARAYDRRIVAELASGVYDGMNPDIVARQLRSKFDIGEYDWERLVRSEVALAQSEGKLEQYRASGYERYDYITAGDDRVSDTCLALEAAGPYAVGRGPLPMRDSHPNCRCTIAPSVQ